MVVGLVLAIAASWLLFAWMPGLDLAVSGWFFDGQGFWVENNSWIEGLRLTLYAAEDIAAFIALGAALLAVWRGRTILAMRARDWLYGFALFALGPGLLVNVIIKPLWGRARPWQVTEFGGHMQFTEAWQISDQVLRGRSFVSGEMAGATALAVVLTMIVRANRALLGEVGYRLGLALVLAIPLVTAWQRMAAGRHFLSDVVFAGLLVALLARLLALVFYRDANKLTAVDIPRDSP
ncbi:MAG: phosphatase PAP2 family protein [bacterium]